MIKPLLILCCLWQPFALAETICTDKAGVLECQAGALTRLQHLGDVLLSGTQIHGASTMVGHLEAINATLANLHHVGDAYLQQTQLQAKFVNQGNVTSVASNVRGPTDITGNVVANGSHFVETTLITGNFIGDSNKFEDPVRITGNFFGHQNVFHSQTEMIGTVNAKESQFYDRLLLTTETSHFENSHLQDILLPGMPHRNQTLYLSHHTVVQGNITFYSGNGKVILSSGARVLGTVKGGKIIAAA